jgi:hypothetical protein
MTVYQWCHDFTRRLFDTYVTDDFYQLHCLHEICWCFGSISFMHLRNWLHLSYRGAVWWQWPVTSPYRRLTTGANAPIMRDPGYWFTHHIQKKKIVWMSPPWSVSDSVKGSVSRYSRDPNYAVPCQTYHYKMLVWSLTRCSSLRTLPVRRGTMNF